MVRPLLIFQRHSKQRKQIRRGVYLLPSMLTVGNLFCGYACVVYAMRGDYITAAPFIGIATLIDTLDGRIARLTGASTAFGHEFDSLADVISFGLAPAILVFLWGLEPLGRLGWTAGFLYVTATAMRLARFNIQSGLTDKQYFVGMPSPAAAGILASTVFAYPVGFGDSRSALFALVLVLVPAFLMVSTIRFRNFGTSSLSRRRSYITLILIAGVIAAIATYPQIVLVIMAYSYLISSLASVTISRMRRRLDSVTILIEENEEPEHEKENKGSIERVL